MKDIQGWVQERGGAAGLSDDSVAGGNAIANSSFFNVDSKIGPAGVRET